MYGVNPSIIIVILIVAIIFVFSIVWTTLKGAPWAPTRMEKVKKMLSMANLKPDEIVYDLGCGDGRFLITSARKYHARAVGIEVNFFLFLWCRLLITILGLRKKVKVKYGNFFKKDLSNADVVVCFLWPSTNNRLEEKLVEELKTTARIVSNKYIFQELKLIKKDENDEIFVYSTEKII